MRRLLFTSIFLSLTLSAFAQFDIPDADFENWTPNSQNLFEEPASGWWTSLNPVRLLGGPVTVEKTSDAYSGNYAAKLQTSEFGSLLLAGLLVPGSFDAADLPQFITQGQPYPFTDLPDRFQGYYKYEPVNGDSCAIAAYFTKYNSTSQQTDTIARADLQVEASVPNYTYFDLEIQYAQMGVMPDSLHIILVASAAGGDFEGEIGSTLYIDDLAFVKTTGLEKDLSAVAKIYPNPAMDWLIIELDEYVGDEMVLRDMQGREIQRQRVQLGKNRMNLEVLTNALYVLELGGKAELIWKK